MRIEDKLAIAIADRNAYLAEIKGLQKYIMELVPYCNNCAHRGNDNICFDCHRKSFMWEHKKIFKSS